MKHWKRSITILRLGSIAAAVSIVGIASMGTAYPAPLVPARDAKVWAAAQERYKDQLQLLEQVVSIDSGSGDVPGGQKVGAILADRLASIGMTITRVPAEVPNLPDNIVAALSGDGRGRILLIGHLDTVFEQGTVGKWPYHADHEKAYGPGVGDEKGGIVCAIEALQILKSANYRHFKSITLLIETAEERGSPGAMRLINKLLADADVELNLEPGDVPDAITVWRKGSSNITIEVKGRAAHAGVAPQEGRNAAEELVHQIAGTEELPKTGDGLTLNLTLMNAGSRFNIIPEDASATFNMRIRDKTQAEAVRRLFEKNAQNTIIPDTKVTVVSGVGYPPLPSNPATNALAAQAEGIYKGIGLTLIGAGNGGGSESALAFEAGVPALDGLGPAGGGYHSTKEFIKLSTVTPRLYLLTKLLMELGKNPPERVNAATISAH
jgi:glutamate carboxypeptidase